MREADKRGERDEPRSAGRRSFFRVGAQAVAALILGRALLPSADLVAGPPDESRDDDDDPPEQVRAVFRQRFGDRPIRKGHVQLDAPEDAPDGRAVPLFIETDLPMTAASYVKGIHIVVDHNPDIYLAGFLLTPALGGSSIDTRIKMRRTSYVRAIAETSGGELWMASKKIWVTMNGCV
jgi:sulfur-oxidizing protein SoxY